MKSPKGFGRTYFSLSSILAHSVARTMQSQIVALTSPFYAQFSSEPLAEDAPPDVLEGSLVLTTPKPCQCNCYYRAKTRLMLRLHHYIPRCPFYTPCFAYRRTGVHPPQTFLTY